MLNQESPLLLNSFCFFYRLLVLGFFSRVIRIKKVKKSDEEKEKEKEKGGGKDDSEGKKLKKKKPKKEKQDEGKVRDNE